MKKCVWLNIRTGEFSESFSKQSFDNANKDGQLEKRATEINWTMIEYTPHCSDFTFCDRMKIVDKSVNNALLTEGANKITELQAQVKSLQETINQLIK